MKTLNVDSIKRLLIIGFLTGLFYGCEKEKDNTTLPSLTTAEITDFMQTYAISGGVVTSSGGDSIISQGLCWDTKPNPSIINAKTIEGLGNRSFTSKISGLLPNTKYFVRAYATNRKGTEYGNEISFTTLKPFPVPGSTVKDFDNNIYHPIIIGRQVWLQENLRTMHYNNGQQIVQMTNNNDGGCWDFNNNSDLSSTYGKLYNFYAITDTRGICPDGYRVPTDEDWQILTNYLGGSSVAGGKLKNTSSVYWKNPNTGATNESGFSAFGSGFREMDGSFQAFGNTSYFWSSSNPFPLSAQANSFGLGYQDATCGINGVGYKTAGLSVRCIMIPYDEVK